MRTNNDAEQISTIIRILNNVDVSEINDVKFSATRRFGNDYKTEMLTAEDFGRCLEDGLAYGIDSRGRLIAVCYGVTEDLDIHIEFIGVRQEHEGKRYGVQLLEHFVRLAREQRVQRITLITSGTAPWNRSYYEKFGFRVLDGDESELPTYIESRLASQRRHFAGMPLLLPRVAMAYDVPGSDDQR